jgi:hypothetical protein
MTGDHDGQHRMLLPRRDEQETFENLDLLIVALRDDRLPSARAAELVKRHVAAIFANIEVRPVTVTRGPLVASPAGTIRWIELLLYREIDYVTARMADNKSGCSECALTWTRHLLQAKEVIAEWAYLREMDTRYEPPSGTPTPRLSLSAPATSQEYGWPTPAVTLSARQGMDLLRRAHIGRIGLSVDALPVIEPVSYTITDGEISILTRREARLSAAASNTAIAFQADGLSDQNEPGWTVLVQGRSKAITDQRDITRIHSLIGEPAGLRVDDTDAFTIRPERVSGRLYGSAKM